MSDCGEGYKARAERIVQQRRQRKRIRRATFQASGKEIRCGKWTAAKLQPGNVLGIGPGDSVWKVDSRKEPAGHRSRHRTGGSV